MTGGSYIRAIMEEGEKARKNGLNKWDNPYCFISQTIEAYAWDEGYGNDPS